MARIRLTNVKREDDRTTRVMRKLCNNYVEPGLHRRCEGYGCGI